MSADYQRGYVRGYYAGSKKKWPAHKPPTPPCEVLAHWQAKADSLRDAVSTFVGACDADDEVAVLMSQALNGYDDASEAVTKWLHSEPLAASKSPKQQ